MTEDTIIQNVPVRVTSLITVTVRTPPGADTKKIMDSLLPAIVQSLKGIPFVAKVDAVGVEEIMPQMASMKDN